MKDKLFIITVIIVVVVAAYLIRRSLTDKPFKGKPVKTVFTIESIEVRTGGYMCDYSCIIHEEKRVQTSKHFYSQVPGDKYAGVYDSLNVENWRIYFHEPVFLSDEKVIEDTGKITKVWDDAILFQFSLGNEVFKRFQVMKKGYKEEMPEIHVGANFPIKIWVKDARRSVMNFE